MTRRSLLRNSAITTAGLAAGRVWALEEDEHVVPFADYTEEFRLEAQTRNPRVKCFDLRRMSSVATPNEEFFAFHQTGTPKVDAASWKLQVGGLVERPNAFSLADLGRRPGRRDVTATIECSGNSGHPQLMNGLVSNGVWTGVELASILGECGVKPESREVVFLGADSENEQKWQAGNAEFVSPHGRSIFIQDALAPGPMLAFKMNGAPLPAEHGFPLRLIMPGWYGMASVKWLTRIEVIDHRYEGRHMARNYHSLRSVESPDGTIWLDTSISKNNLKSVVARVTRQRIGSRFLHRIAGAAWGGESRIEKVEVRVDDGAWRDARIDLRSGPFGWLLWSCEWPDAEAGTHTLVSRAINARGEIQPARDEWRKRLASNREDNSQWPRVIVIAGA
jgi:DMSO/TMAO reductase YedYZ molybdopterin-dependent catalytic subunit